MVLDLPCDLHTRCQRSDYFVDYVSTGEDSETVRVAPERFEEIITEILHSNERNQAKKSQGLFQITVILE